MNIPFKDISYAQGSYNMAANTDELIAIRMSSGDGSAGLHFDTEATINYNNASHAGKVIIGYHFGGTNDPTDEANFFLKAMSPFTEGDIYALDVERGQSWDWINTFVQVVFNATGCWPLVYMNISTANSQWSGVNKNCGLWLAAPSWGFDQTITELNAGIIYVAQQGPVVNGVDTDMFFATDLDHVKDYGYKASATPPAPEPTPTPLPDPLPPVITPPTAPPAVPNPTPDPSVPPVDPPVVNPPVAEKPSFLTSLIDWLLALIGVTRKK